MTWTTILRPARRSSSHDHDTTHPIRAPQAHHHQDAARLPVRAGHDRRAQRLRRGRRNRHGRQQGVHRHRSRPAIADGIRLQRVHGRRACSAPSRSPTSTATTRSCRPSWRRPDDTEPSSLNSSPSRSAAAYSASSAPASPSPPSPSSLPTTDYGFLVSITNVARVITSAGFAGAAGAVLGAGIGAVVRNVGGAVTLAVFTFMVAPPLVVQLANGTASWMPANLANVISGTVDDVSQPAALAALTVWAVVPAADRTDQRATPRRRVTRGHRSRVRRRSGRPASAGKFWGGCCQDVGDAASPRLEDDTDAYHGRTNVRRDRWHGIRGA